MPGIAARSRRRAWSAGRAAAPFLALASMLAAVAVAGPGTSRGADDMPAVTTTQADDGRTVDLAVGQILVVSLEENPTTGYRWAIESQGEAVELRESRFEAPSASAMGTAGRRLFELEASQAGTAVIEAKLWREWEGDSSIVGRFSLTVRVR